MDKIIYREVAVDDNLILVVQALIDKQAELVKFVDELQKIAEKQEIVK